MRESLNAAGLLLGMALITILSGCAGPFVREDLKTEYKPRVKTVAILPFKNLSNEEKSREAHISLREGVFAELKRKDVEYTTRIQEIAQTDRMLSESGVAPENIGSKTPSELGQILNVDVILQGTLIKYHEKGKTGQFLTAILFSKATGSEVICRVSITDCQTQNLLWDWEIKEKGGLLTSPESVANKIGKKVAKKWPFKKE